jgi:hypothetical protein
VPQPIGLCVPLTATNVCAYGTPLENPPCDPYANIVDAWFTFNTGTTTDHTIILQEDSADGLLAAVYADCADVNPIACFDAVVSPIALTGLDPGADYFVRVWNHGYDEAGTFTICDETDIDDAIGERSIDAIALHPVPVSDELWIDGLPMDAIEVVIGDPQGRILFRERAAPSLDVSSLAPGGYLLRITCPTGDTVLRFVKQ